MRYWVHEDRRGGRSTIHLAHCPHCNHGHGHGHAPRRPPLHELLRAGAGHPSSGSRRRIRRKQHASRVEAVLGTVSSPASAVQEEP